MFPGEDILDLQDIGINPSFSKIFFQKND